MLSQWPFASNVSLLLHPKLVFICAIFAGVHDARHVNVQSYDALWLGPDTPTCPEHQ